MQQISPTSLQALALRPENAGMAWHRKLRWQATQKGLSGPKIAEMLSRRRAQKVTGTSVNEWLSGTQPRFEVLLQLCDLLEVPMSWVFDDSIPDDGSSPESIAAHLAFAEAMKERGPRAVVALLWGSPSPARDLGDVALPNQAKRRHKTPADRPDDPLAGGGLPTAAPGPRGGPAEVELDDPTARKK